VEKDDQRESGEIDVLDYKTLAKKKKKKKVV
jgi:RecB family exonuclease